MLEFSGVKIALISGGKVLVIRRDNKPGLRYAGMWDFAGGGRESDESPFECVRREVEEELGLKLEPQSVIWEKTYPAMHDPAQVAYFMVAHIDEAATKTIVFGDEGEGWKLMPVDEMLADPNVVPPLKQRMRDYLDAQDLA